MGPHSLHDVSEISAILVRTPGNPGDLTSILQYIAQTAQDAFSSDACVILAFNPITGSFMGSQTAGNLQVENRLLHDKPRANGATQQVLKDGIFLIEDLEVKPQYHNRFTRKVGIRAFAGLAMRSRHRQRPLGVIYLDFIQPKKFSSTDSESFRIFAIQASLLLQETWLAHNYEEVARIGQQVNQNLGEVGDLFRELQTYVASVLDESHTLLLAVSQPQTNTLNVYVKGQGFSICVNTPIQGIYKHVIETQEPKFIQQLSREAEQLPSQIIYITGTEEKESYIFVPLMLRGVSLGVLSIQHSLPEAYGQEDLFVLQLLANYIALALHNMRLYNSLNQLNETGQILTQQLESEQTLQATVDKIREATQADVVVLYPYDPIAQHFAFPARIAGILLDSSIKPMFPSRPDDIASLTWSRKKPIFAKESAFLYTELQGDVPIRQGNFQERENIRSTAALPLQAGDEIVGILFVNFRQTQRFDAAQKLFIEGLAHYAAIAIKNAQVFGILSLRRVRELEILQNIDRELSRTLELETVLNTLLRLAHEHVPAEEASILLHSPRTQVLETVAAIGRHAEASLKQTISLHETKAITRWVLEEKKPA
ncbi:MAG: GAF domain-containing protein, partial [Ktedonobacteraceae bacterium]